MDAATITRLLADDRRRRVFAAVVLGANSPEAVGERTGLRPREVLAALDRLAEGELVSLGEDGAWAVVAATFRAAAKAIAEDEEAGGTSSAALSGASPEAARTLRGFVKGGRLTAIPVPRTKRLVLLDLLAQEFEPGARYAEREVNERLGRWHDDTASLRRYLIDEGFMEREAGVYWRAGGTVELDEG